MSSFSERVAKIQSDQAAAADHASGVQGRKAEAGAALDLRLRSAATIAGQVATQLSQRGVPHTQTIKMLGEPTRNWRRQLVWPATFIHGWRGNSQFDGPLVQPDTSGWATMVTEAGKVLYLSQGTASDSTMRAFPTEYRCRPEALGPTSTIDAANGIAGLRQYTSYEHLYPDFVNRIEDGLATLVVAHSLQIVE